MSSKSDENKGLRKKFEERAALCDESQLNSTIGVN